MKLITDTETDTVTDTVKETQKTKPPRPHPPLWNKNVKKWLFVANVVAFLSEMAFFCRHRGGFYWRVCRNPLTLGYLCGIITRYGCK